MAITKIARSSFLSGLFSDETLTKKAYLNALASSLEYGSQIMVAFFVTPWVVAGLGDYFYGVWQVLNRLVFYISPTSGKPTTALKWMLANQQSSADYELKRRYVGSSIAVLALSLPVMGVIGGALAWFTPYWLSAPTASFWQVRATAGLLVANLAMMSVGQLPESVLRGENQGYKRMGLTAILVFVGGGFTWLALYLKMGIAGVAAAALAASLLSGLLFLFIVRVYVPWFGVARPSSGAMRRLLGLSWWFLAWDLVMQLMMASDVVVLGLLKSVESVTSYSLTKYAPETLVSVVAIVVFGIIPGLGGVIGSGDLQKAARVRNEIMSLTWLVVTVMGSSVLLWNRFFIGLWVGIGQYAGAVPDLLIVVVAVQFALIRTDAAIIDLTLRLERKVLMGALSVALALAVSGVLVGYFRLGVVGLSLGLIAGRSILSVGYPLLIGRFLGTPLSSQLRSVLRPALVTMLLFATACGLDSLAPVYTLSGVRGWAVFFLSASVTAGVVLLLAFCAGLSGRQRRSILQRIRMAVTRASG